MDAISLPSNSISLPIVVENQSKSLNLQRWIIMRHLKRDFQILWRHRCIFEVKCRWFLKTVWGHEEGERVLHQVVSCCYFQSRGFERLLLIKYNFGAFCKTSPISRPSFPERGKKMEDSNQGRLLRRTAWLCSLLPANIALPMQKIAKFTFL